MYVDDLILISTASRKTTRYINLGLSIYEKLTGSALIVLNLNLFSISFQQKTRQQYLSTAFSISKPAHSLLLILVSSYLQRSWLSPISFYVG